MRERKHDPSEVLRHTGSPTKRVEDSRLLRGGGRFIDDVSLPRLVHVGFVRSPHAHAAIRRLDPSSALQNPEVVAVFTADDLRAVALPLSPSLEASDFVATEWPVLADRFVHFCGEAVAAVVAISPYDATDGVGRVEVEYEPLPAVVSLSQALTDGRVLYRRTYRHGDVERAFADAQIVLRERFYRPRCAPCPMEPRGIVADWDGQTLVVWASTQAPHILRGALAHLLRLDEARIRVVVPEVGGGFGLKFHVFPEDVVVAAIARLLQRPVKWIEQRRENLTAASHAREQVVDIELAATRDGQLSGIRARVSSDGGAYHIHPPTQALEPAGTASILPGPYVVPAYAYEAVAVATHKAPLGAYRGVGMTNGVLVMERMMDMLAERLGLDPAEVRKRNLIPSVAYPFTSSSGLIYDSGNLPAALERALEVAGYERARQEQAQLRAEGRYIGVGIACFTEYTGLGAEAYRRRGVPDVPGPEGLRIKVESDGSIRCFPSMPSQGQGHATTLAQMVADELGVSIERIRVEPVDTATSPGGTGAFASRGAVALSGLARPTAGVLRRKIAIIAASILEASPDDVTLRDGVAFVRGAPDHTVTLRDIARLAYAPPLGGLPEGVEPGLEATRYHDPPGPTFSSGVHVATVEVNPETGRVAIRRYVVVEDCGRVLNPLLVEGQVHGGVAQGIGEALFEAVVYDEMGQIVSGTLMDYALPRAEDLPDFEVEHIETLSPLVLDGVKGMGEGGTIAAPAAIANAVADAVRHLGVQVRQLPIKAEALAMSQSAR